jgi:Ala-tRNA(Pro) deacylase
MVAKRVKDFLDREKVRYTAIAHAITYTATRTARSAGVAPQDFAKTVIVDLDGRLAMAVLPASESLDLKLLKKATGAKHVRLALESEFDRWFPGCEPGAMPPFGNLYGLEVFVARSLAADERIAFNAGSHAELLSIDYNDFARLVQPIVATLSFAPRSRPAGGAGGEAEAAAPDSRQRGVIVETPPADATAR